MFQAPHRIYWEVTRGCNLRCLHCRATPTELSSPEDLPTQECMKIMDQMAQVCRPALVLTGGEPLFRSDIYDLGRYGVKVGFKMGLATNGTLVTPEVAQKIYNAGFHRVSISLDGADPATHDEFRRMPGAFEAAVEGIRNLKALGVYLQVNTSVTTHNEIQLEDVLRLVTDLKADAWHLFLLVPVGCGIQIAEEMQVNAKEYERILNWIEEKTPQAPLPLRAICAPHFTRIRAQRTYIGRSLGEKQVTVPMTKGCTAGMGMCFISHRGRLYPCGYLPVEAGDLLTQSFGEIWEGSPVLQSLRDVSLLKGKCGICEFRHVCSGCRARAYGMTGDYLAEEPFCLYQPGSLTSVMVEEVHGQAPLEGIVFAQPWTEEAKSHLFHVPHTLRPQVVRWVEAYATARGIEIITPGVMREARGQGSGAG